MVEESEIRIQRLEGPVVREIVTKMMRFLRGTEKHGWVGAKVVDPSRGPAFGGAYDEQVGLQKGFQLRF